MDEAFRILDDGRVFFDYGPASMVVTARRGDENLSDLAASAFPFLRDSLSEIAGALPILRQSCSLKRCFLCIWTKFFRREGLCMQPLSCL